MACTGELAPLQLRFTAGAVRWYCIGRQRLAARAVRCAAATDDGSLQGRAAARAGRLAAAAVDEQPATVAAAIALGILEAREGRASSVDRGAQHTADGAVQAANLLRR